MVKEIKEQSVVVANERKELMEIPFGVLVWAAVRFFCLSPFSAPCFGKTGEDKDSKKKRGALC